jgi:hypothetical protein
VTIIFTSLNSHASGDESRFQLLTAWHNKEIVLQLQFSPRKKRIRMMMGCMENLVCRNDFIILWHTMEEAQRVPEKERRALGAF